ncbi:MAG TPA: hypothetical protein VHE30_19875 [Polyangiaceae bacterium]|nr:hypothetical protein [Polyangiaceae bacterium]
MSIRRITLSVPEETASRIKKAARGAPVSAWVTALIEEHLDDENLERQWEEFCAKVKPTSADVKRAEAIHERVTGTRRRKGVA